MEENSFWFFLNYLCKTFQIFLATIFFILHFFLETISYSDFLTPPKKLEPKQIDRTCPLLGRIPGGESEIKYSFRDMVSQTVKRFPCHFSYPGLLPGSLWPAARCAPVVQSCHGEHRRVVLPLLVHKIGRGRVEALLFLVE